MAWILRQAEKAIKKLTTPLPIKELAFQTIRFLAACGHSHPVSFVLRPIAEASYLKFLVGGVFLLGIVWWARPLSFTHGVGGQFSLNLNTELEIEVGTRETSQMPIKQFVVTQGYSLTHSGYDLAADNGTEIRPVMAGVVSEVKKGWYGYGNMILVDHENGYQTRYAHLSKFLVEVGQKVSLEQVIGLVGSSGRSTGPHLHLEVIENGRLINPKTVLGI